MLGPTYWCDRQVGYREVILKCQPGYAAITSLRGGKVEATLQVEFVFGSQISQVQICSFV